METIKGAVPAGAVEDLRLINATANQQSYTNPFEGTYNVEMILKDIAAGMFNNMKVMVDLGEDYLTRVKDIDINPDYAMKLPIEAFKDFNAVFIECGPPNRGSIFSVDGNHRTWKLWHMGLRRVPGVIVPYDMRDKYRMYMEVKVLGRWYRVDEAAMLEQSRGLFMHQTEEGRAALKKAMEEEVPSHFPSFK